MWYKPKIQKSFRITERNLVPYLVVYLPDEIKLELNLTF